MIGPALIFFALVIGVVSAAGIDTADAMAWPLHAMNAARIGAALSCQIGVLE
jgi:hypothetical protein